MKFSTKTTYGLRAMIMLGKNWPKNISLSKIAKEEKISLKYLERLFSKLKKAKLISAEIGAGGGYVLTNNPQNISIYKIIEALEGKMSLFYCLDKRGKTQCNQRCTCNVTKVLSKVQIAISKSLKSMTLADLI